MTFDPDVVGDDDDLFDTIGALRSFVVAFFNRVPERISANNAARPPDDFDDDDNDEGGGGGGGGADMIIKYAEFQK